MNMVSFEEKVDLIKDACLKERSSDPVEVAVHLMKMEVISLHGPEHHMLDGAAFLTAYKNAGGAIDLPTALDALASRASAMPGAMCGFWGVCGSSASIGAALSVIHGTGPMSDDAFYKDHMEYTSEAIRRIGAIGGPRCCKRNAYLSLITASNFVKRKYGIVMTVKPFSCGFSLLNKDCLGKRCPFNKEAVGQKSD